MSDGRGKVVVGISPSLAGLEALRFAVAEAQRRRVMLVAVRVWSFNAGTRARPGWQWERELADEARRTIAEVFRAAVGQFPPDLDVVGRAICGPVAVALKGNIDSPDDLLVIGAARRRWFAGRVVPGCAHDPGCPIVVVPRPELARVVGGRLAVRRMVREAAASLTAEPGPR